MASAFTWDTTIAFVNDPAAAAKAFAKHGLAIGGAADTGHGTAETTASFGAGNLALVTLGDAATAAAEDPATGLAHTDAAALLPAEPGFWRVGMRVDDIEAAAGELTTKGVETGPVVDTVVKAGGKDLPCRVVWLLHDDQSGDDQPRLPFLISWGEGAEAQLPAGGASVREALWSVHLPGAVATRLGELFDLPLLSHDKGRNFELLAGHDAEGHDLTWHIQDGAPNAIEALGFDAADGTSFDFAVEGMRFHTR